MAATSILLIPFVAIGVGGSALASLLGAGESVAAAAGALVAGSITTGKTVVALGTKLALVPGGAKIKSRLVEATQKNLAKVQETVQTSVVQYLSPSIPLATLEQKREELERAAKEKKRERLVEIDVTGFEMETVLRCETGKKKVDKVSCSVSD